MNSRRGGLLMHRWRFISVLLMVLLICSFVLVLPQTVSAATYIVTNSNDSGLGSLRDAIIDANGAPGLDTISFNIPGPGPHTISLTASLEIFDPVIIDGYSQPGALPATGGTPATLKIVLDGTGALAIDAAGLKVFPGGGGSVISGMVINKFVTDGITLTFGSGNNTITGNYIGTDYTGAISQPNGRAGIYLSSSSNNTIGGETPDARNLISGNLQMGIQIDAGSGNTVKGNYIGTDVTGLSTLGIQPNGITIGGSNNIIGGTSAGARNIISGNTIKSIQISGAASTGNQIMGNFIGTNVLANAVLVNGAGVVITGGPSANIIGGTAPGAGNLISGSAGYAISIGDSSEDNQVLGNLIGTDVTGKIKLGNLGDGIVLGSSNNIVGGILPGARNVISGSGKDGIIILNPGNSGNQVLGNYIGTDITGTLPLGNNWSGISIVEADNNTIGGNVAGARNIISGNGWGGITITGAGNNNFVQGNYIGTDLTGSVAVPNFSAGVVLDNGPTGNTIGGNNPGDGNVISGNTNDGIRIGRTTGNFLYGNIIGLTSSGSSILPNGVGVNLGSNLSIISGNVVSGNTTYGIWVVSGNENVIEKNYIGTNSSGDSLGNMVGIRIGGICIGNVIGSDNIIWYNGQDGIQVDGNQADFNTITENSITINGISGIDLQFLGNDDILPPVITSVTATMVTGTAVAPDGSTVEIFQDTGDQGKVYIGSTTVAGGSFVFNGSAPAGGNLTATVTDPTGNTSEFSIPVANNLEPPPPGGETEVGGEIYPISKVALLAPWISLLVFLVIITAFAWQHRRIIN
jgi:parallel beta-helix repeat protein